MSRDVEVWLTAHDLGKYADVFAENEITLADLPELAEDDLKEMGLPIGPRRRARKAIAALGTEARTAIAPEPALSETGAAETTIL